MLLFFKSAPTLSAGETHPGHFLCHFLFDQVHGDHPPAEAPPLGNRHDRRDCVRVDSGRVSGVSALLLLRNRSEAAQDGLLRGLAAARRRRLLVRDRQLWSLLSVNPLLPVTV